MTDFPFPSQSDPEFEISGTYRDSGEGIRLTIRRYKLDFAPFSRLKIEVLDSKIQNESPIVLDTTLYIVDPSFRNKFMKGVSNRSQLVCSIATVQTGGKVVNHIAQDHNHLRLVLEKEALPVVWNEETIIRDQREIGRKIGMARKDLSGLKRSTIDIQYLELLESSSEADAYEEVEKSKVFLCPTLESLREQNMDPGLAYFALSVYRLLKRRPKRSIVCRQRYVAAVPQLMNNLLTSCKNRQEAAVCLEQFERNESPGFKDVFGPHLYWFICDLSYYRTSLNIQPFFNRTLNTETLKSSIQKDPIGTDLTYEEVKELLSRPNTTRPRKRSNLPVREIRNLKDLVRTGPNLPFVPDIGDVSAEFGLSGIEFGKYVGRSDGEIVGHALMAALTDLKSILGDWIKTLFREGNLSVALGARGSGQGMAHYEPSLRVINMTKTRGDGSLAHEVGHYIDHMLANRSIAGESRFLSDRVTMTASYQDPIAHAMKEVMSAIVSYPYTMKIEGKVNGNFWYRPRWMNEHGYSKDATLTECFKAVLAACPKEFAAGRYQVDRYQRLAHSIARMSEQDFEIEMELDRESEYLQYAKKIASPYWHRKWELFARAFEAYIEDRLASESRTSEYLVYGTRHGKHYPQNEERTRINQAIEKLIAVCSKVIV